MASHQLQISSMTAIILLGFFSSCLSIRVPTSTPNISQVFEGWMAEHNRVYPTNEEKARRFQIFQTKYHRLKTFNEEAGKKKHYTLGLNRFSDLTRKEFQRVKCVRESIDTIDTAGIKIVNSSSLDYDVKEEYVNTSRSIDWVARGVVSPARDQGLESCGACWAIAAVASVEAANRMTLEPDEYAQVPELSIQQVLDCANGDKCAGGSELDAYMYVLMNRGLATKEDYPYTHGNGTCNPPENDAVDFSGIDGIAVVRPQTESRLKKAVSIRPVTAGIATNSFEFENYAGGLFHGTCGEEIDHTVLVVGFEEDDTGFGFWKIQNSWGVGWGEHGYMRMEFGTALKCQILQEASFPFVV